MLDGRHTGTGGGNHVTLGGATPADSPLLRRPTCCEASSRTGRTIRRSRTCSRALFIGPTSQAPRVDEARDDRLYELEIAFQQLGSPHAAATSPQAVARRPAAAAPADRPHRQHAPRRVLDRQALFARRPDRTPGPARVPRVRDAAARAHERRADAAAARARRALLAAALRGRLVRWGTALHDRWLLPHFVAADMRDVVDDLRAPAIRSSRVVRPFVEFRFPRFGTVDYDGMTIELRRRSSRGTCSARR
jgi:uncharacterized protein (DUF2126 family)